ncbi:MAG: CHC2 zinc finger domain-containing protein [Vicinamibacterales bacterium]
MRIPRDDLRRIKAANDLCEVVREQGIVLRRRGRTYFGLCPFHCEQTASFAVSREAGLFHCFGCGAGGDVIRFVERSEHVSFPEAVRRLARRAGVALADLEHS